MVDADPEGGRIEEPIQVKLASNTESQRDLKRRVLSMVDRHGGLDKWLFTREVMIDDSSSSHSHPILTLGANGESTRSDMGLLSVFLHEQMHWHVSQNHVGLKLALEDVRRMYPKVKVGREEGGARNEESTYLHLLVCFLEFEALSELVGKKEALNLIVAKPYYRWIYGAVVSDYVALKGVVDERHLSLGAH